MPGKVNKNTPTIISGVLYTDDPATTGARVGSAAWFDWLASASRFYYDGSEGTFTARRETKQRGGDYWAAYRQMDGKLCKKYLGKPAALTLDRLQAAAAALATVQPT